MRPTMIAAVPLLASLAVMPAEAQVSARIHLDIPIGRPGAVAYAAPRRQVVVREYDQNRFGAWDRYYDEWIPETVYYYDGYYYDYPIVAYAEPLLVYRFRDEWFFAPRQREFTIWQERFHGADYRRDMQRAYRPIYRDDRNDHRYQAPRDDRNGRDGRDIHPAQPPRDVHPVQPQRDDRNGRDIRPVQPQRNDRGGRQAPAPRDAGRSRSRPH